MRGSIVLCKVFLLVTAIDKGHNENITSLCIPHISADNPYPQEGDRVVIKAQICPENRNNIIHWRKCKNLVGTCVAESCTADNLASNATSLQYFFIIEKARISIDSCFVKLETHGLMLKQSVFVYKHPELFSVIVHGNNDTDIVFKNEEIIVLEVKTSCMFPLPMIKILHKDDSDGSVFNLLDAEPGATVSNDECNALEHSTSTRFEISVTNIFEKSHKGLLQVQILYGDRIIQHSINVTLDRAQPMIPTAGHILLALLVLGSLMQLSEKTKYHQAIWDAIKRFVSNANTLTHSIIPAEPSNIFVKVTGPNTIDVSWNPPNRLENDGSKYFICFNAKYSKEEKREEVEGTETKYQLRELKPDTMYTIKVVLSMQSVETDVGIIKAKTQPSEPSAAPKNVRGEPYRVSSKIKVTWNPPPKDQQNGEIKGYKIFYAKYDPSESYHYTRETSVSAEKPEEVLSWLSSSTEYEISVLAFNCKGDGPKSTLIRVKTAEDGSILDPDATMLHFLPYLVAFPIIFIDFEATTQSATYLSYIMWSVCAGVLIHGIIDGVYNYEIVLRYIRSKFKKRNQRDEEATEPNIQYSARRNQRDEKATDDETIDLLIQRPSRRINQRDKEVTEEETTELLIQNPIRGIHQPDEEAIEEETTEPLIQNPPRRRIQRDEEATNERNIEPLIQCSSRRRNQINEEVTEALIHTPPIEAGLTCLYSRTK